MQIAYPADGPEQRSLRFSGMFSGSATVLGPRQSLATDGNSAGCAHLTVREVRLGIRKTPIDVRSQGTANVIAAMQRHGVHRLIVQSTYGVGASEGKLPFAWTMIFALLLRPQIVDTARQEDLVKASALDWTLIQPAGLTDAAITRPTFISEDSATRSMEVSRRQVAEVLADVASRSIHVHASLAVSS